MLTAKILRQSHPVPAPAHHTLGAIREDRASGGIGSASSSAGTSLDPFAPVRLLVTAQMRELTLCVNDESLSAPGSAHEVCVSGLARAQLSGLDVRFSTANRGSTLSGALGNLTIEDTRTPISPARHHPRPVVSTSGRDAKSISGFAVAASVMRRHPGRVR